MTTEGEGKEGEGEEGEGNKGEDAESSTGVASLREINSSQGREKADSASAKVGKPLYLAATPFTSASQASHES